MTTIWTIGHSTRPLADFISLLTDNALAGVADVRRFPGSRRFPHFSREALAASLADHAIAYHWYPDLGGRRNPRSDSPNTNWRVAAFRGFADYMETDAFSRAIQQLQQQARAQPTAVMCSEAVWWRCHRGLISDYLKSAGFDVLHILAPGKVEIHPYTSAARIVDGNLRYYS